MMKLQGILVAGVMAATLSGTAQAQDWTGFYAGLSATTHGSEITPSGAPFGLPGDSVSPGIFAGYNHAVGSNWIIGGELSYDAADTSFLPSLPIEVSNTAELRGRVGYAMGNVMPYVALGVVSSDMGVLGGNYGSQSGYSMGLGLEYMVSDAMSLRTEFKQTRYSDVLEADLGPGWSIEDRAIAIGAAFHF
jgi:outer membrane immunogenic protein